MTNHEAITKLTNIAHDDIYAWHPSILTAFGMAVDALRGADGDCISRQAAIDALCKAGCGSGYCGISCDDVKAIEDLPSFPQRHENDCVSRKMAIDAMEESKKKYFDRRVIIGKMQDIVNNLPSAQPEQRWIPCGKCIHADGKHRWCKVLDRTINEDYFCYWAEPWKEGEADG